jgi:hypothetical protein
MVMFRLNNFLSFALFFYFVFTVSAGVGQRCCAQTQVSDSPKDHFEYSTGIALSLNGMNTFHSVQMVDENGFEYDLWSLLREQAVKDSVGFSMDQLVQMQEIKQDVMASMDSRSPLLPDSEKFKDELKAEFVSAEQAALELMSEEQRIVFDQVASQMGIRHSGLANYLKAHGAKYGVDVDQLKNLEHTSTLVKSKMARQSAGAIKKANQKLIDQLPATAAEKFRVMLDEDKDRWMASLLFAVESYSSKRAIQSPRKARFVRPDFLRKLVMSGKTRDAIKVSDDQLEKLKALKAEQAAASDDDQKQQIGNRISQILDQEQVRKLKLLAILSEVKKSGTVNALCYGVMSRELGFSAEESGQLFAQGTEISREMVQELRGFKGDLMRESIGGLPEEEIEKIVNLMGEPVLNTTDLITDGSAKE